MGLSQTEENIQTPLAKSIWMVRHKLSEIAVKDGISWDRLCEADSMLGNLIPLVHEVEEKLSKGSEEGKSG